MKNKNLYLFLLIIPIVAYCRNAPPAITLYEDASENILQAYQGGIDHPCGYPVYLWIGKIFMFLSHHNINSMNDVSLFFSVLTLIILFMFMRRIGLSGEASILSVLIFSFTPMFMRYSLIPSVYNVNAFFIISVLFIFYIWTENHSLVYILAGNFLYGLSLGVYFPNILMLIPIAIFIIDECKGNMVRFFKTISISFLSIGMGAIGPMIYIYLRSKTNPPVGTMYNPDNIKNFFLYITGVQYGSFHVLSWPLLLYRLNEHSTLIFDSFIGYGVLLAFYGVFIEWGRNRGFTLLLVLSSFIDFIYFSNFRVFDYDVKVILCYLTVAIFLGIGLNRMLSLRNIYLKYLYVLLISFSIVLQIMTFLPSHSQLIKKDVSILSTCTRILDILPKNAVIFAKWDSFTSLLCVQTILKERQDVAVYELTNQPRNYRIRDKIETFTWHDYIDKNINNKNRPIFSLGYDDYLRKKYLVARVKGSQLFRILPRGVL